MAGLINIGRQTLGQATQGFGAASQLEQSRNAMGRQIDAARNAQRMSMATTGAGLGSSIGVNKLMANNAMVDAFNAGLSAQLPAPYLGTAATTTAPTINAVSAGAAPLNSAALTANVGGLGTVATPTGAMTLAAPTSAAAPIAAVETGAAILPEAIAAQTAAVEAGAATAGAASSTGTMAALGAVATPLLIGAAGALLLDSLFDIF